MALLNCKPPRAHYTANFLDYAIAIQKIWIVKSSSSFFLQGIRGWGLKFIFPCFIEILINCKHAN